MNKKLKNVLTVVAGVIAIVAFVGMYLIGFDSGYNAVNKDLTQEYELGIEDCASAIASMYSFYPEELNNPDGQVITKLIQHKDFIRILWVKNSNGRLTHGIVTTYSQLPVVK